MRILGKKIINSRLVGFDCWRFLGQGVPPTKKMGLNSKRRNHRVPSRHPTRTLPRRIGIRVVGIHYCCILARVFGDLGPFQHCLRIGPHRVPLVDIRTKLAVVVRFLKICLKFLRVLEVGGGAVCVDFHKLMMMMVLVVVVGWGFCFRCSLW